MKKKQLIVLTALTAVLAGTTIYLLRKNKRKKHKKRRVTVSDAGYETAYDIHYPLRYKRGGAAI
jgi:hypothetical protein